MSELNNLTKSQLIEIAKENNIEYQGLSKTQLISELEKVNLNEIDSVEDSTNEEINSDENINTVEPLQESVNPSKVETTNLDIVLQERKMKLSGNKRGVCSDMAQELARRQGKPICSSFEDEVARRFNRYNR